MHAGFVLDLNIVVAELLRFKMSKSFHSKHYTIIMLLTPETQTERERGRQTNRQTAGELEKKSPHQREEFLCFVLFLFLLFYWGFVVASGTAD